MNDMNTYERIKSVKSKIEKLIENGHLKEAMTALDMYDEKMPGDPDICSMRAVIHIIEGDVDKAEEVLLDGLKKDSFHFDLLYNLAYIYEQRGQLWKAMELYCKADTVADLSQKANISEAVARLKLADNSLQPIEKDRIAFFCKPGLDNFLGDIVQGLSEDYFVRKIIVSDFSQIDEGMEWADVCWFEWCDELLIYGSSLPLAGRKKIICRLHSYEAFTNYIQKVEWSNVDKIIFVAEHIRQYVINNSNSLKTSKTVVIPNGIDTDKFSFKKRNKGFNIAYVGYINFKKGPMLLLHTFKSIHDKDKRYKLYIAGKYQEPRYELYFKQMAEEMGLSDSIIFEGWQDDVSRWLEDKNYILCTSILEGNPVGLMEAMARGIKPVIHNFVGARNMYPADYIWNTIDEAVEMVTTDMYNSEEYRSYIENNYSLEKQLQNTKAVIDELLSYKGVLLNVEKMVKGEIKNENLHYDDLTVLIPCYNRAKILKEDLDSGLKLGSQPKVIADDKYTFETDRLDKIEDNKDLYNAKIIRKENNEGVAHARYTGLKNISTKLTAILDDDDMLLCLNQDRMLLDVSQLSEKAVLLVPRYVLNYDGNRISIGYDRERFNESTSLEVLKYISSSGEIMALLAGGAIGETEELRKHSDAKKFIVSEDFITLTRILSANPDKMIRTTESLVYVRRISGSSLSKTLTPKKLALSLIAQSVGCYHCVRNEIADKYEVIEWMKERASLLQKLYDFGESFEVELIAYLTGEISEEAFMHFLELYDISLEASLDELAPELKRMRNLFFTESSRIP